MAVFLQSAGKIVPAAGVRESFVVPVDWPDRRTMHAREKIYGAPLCGKTNRE